MEFFSEPENCRSNYWLSAVICEDRVQRDELLRETNKLGIMTRPVWRLMHHSAMFHKCLKGDLSNAEWLGARVVSLPSSAVSEKKVTNEIGIFGTSGMAREASGIAFILGLDPIFIAKDETVLSETTDLGHVILEKDL